MEDVFRISFREYFWTPLPFLFLLIIAFFEGCIASRLLKREKFNKYIITAFLISNITGYFIEYFLSIFVNGGNIMLVWIPWVKIIGPQDLFNYLISFPLIFIMTLLIEGSMNWLLLSSSYPLPTIFKVTLRANFVSLLILIVIFNCIIFNFIKGQENLRPTDDFLPEPVLIK